MLLPRRERTRAHPFPLHLWDTPDGRESVAPTSAVAGAAGTIAPPRVELPARIEISASPEPLSPPTAFGVLASSSSGNCAVLLHGQGRNRRVTLIDAGISPRRTNAFLEAFSLDIERIDEIVFTHLDNDHCHRGWIRALPKHARFRIFRGHRGRARRAGLLRRRTYLFDESPFELRAGVTVSPAILDHDDLGVAAFRFDFRAERPASLGFATDLGHPTQALVRTLAEVDVLAIESNYCPRMQFDSDRPAFLKDRIMGGAGHLSNEECRATVAAIAPRSAVVLLHLSRECNRPELAARYHHEAPYALTVASPDTPTDLIHLVS